MFQDADIVYSYARSQAIADGVLVDVSQTAQEAGFRVPVALTAAAWAECVAWNESDTEATGMPQDEAGRLWDVVWMAGLAARRNREGNRAAFVVLRVARGARRATRCALEMHIGGGDEGEPVATIGMPGED